MFHFHSFQLRNQEPENFFDYSKKLSFPQGHQAPITPYHTSLSVTGTEHRSICKGDLAHLKISLRLLEAFYSNVSWLKGRKKDFTEAQ